MDADADADADAMADDSLISSPAGLLGVIGRELESEVLKQALQRLMEREHTYSDMLGTLLATLRLDRNRVLFKDVRGISTVWDMVDEYAEIHQQMQAGVSARDVKIKGGYCDEQDAAAHYMRQSTTKPAVGMRDGGAGCERNKQVGQPGRQKGNIRQR